MNPKIRSIVLLLAVVAVGLVYLIVREPSSIAPLPQEYDIAAMNALIDSLPPRKPPTTLEEHRDYLLEDMREFMKSGAASYQEDAVKKCGVILDSFIRDVRDSQRRGNQESIRGVVKTAVLALNQLNAACEHGLIETMERENLVVLMMFGAKEAGYPESLLNASNDFTLPEREW